jgi:aspartate/methionine/tyrosine aminotransferase
MNLTLIRLISSKKQQNVLLMKIIATILPVEGYLELKEAICRKFKRDNNSSKPTQIVVSTGAKQSLYNIAK